MAVAGIGIIVNSVTAMLFMRGDRHDLNIRGAFLHMAADALVSLGVVVAGALYLWQGWQWIDPVMSLVIVVVIILTACRTVFPCRWFVPICRVCPASRR